MFGKRECKACREKDRQIEVLAKLFEDQKNLADVMQKVVGDLRTQNKDLLDRLMSLNERAFLNYKAETRINEPIYPIGVDSKGEKFSYKEIDPEVAKEEIHRAFGEEVINVEDDK